MSANQSAYEVHTGTEAPTGTENKPKDFDFSTREAQLLIAKKITPLTVGLLRKINNCFDTQSMLNLPDGKSVMFNGRDGDRLSFRCGANLIIELPIDFLNETDEDLSLKLDFLIMDWVFVLNGIDISIQAWYDNPLITTERLLNIVPQGTDEVLKTKKDKSLKGRWRRRVELLLPKTVVGDKTGSSKIHQDGKVKFPKLQIYKR